MSVLIEFSFHLMSVLTSFLLYVIKFGASSLDEVTVIFVVCYRFMSGFTAIVLNFRMYSS